MRKGLLIVCLVVLSAGVVFAQQSTPPLGPIGTLEAGDFRALAVTQDGDRLLVADAQNMQVRVYDFSNPAKPVLLSAPDVSGTPVLMAGGDGYGLTAVTTSDKTDTIEVIAPQLAGSNTPYTSGYNYIDIGKNPRSIFLSPDDKWGIEVSEQGYTLLQINTPSDISSFPSSDTIIDAALSDKTAYLLSDQNLQSAPLDDSDVLNASKTLALVGVPSHLILNADASKGAVVVGDNQIVFFDPAALEKTGTFTVSGSAVTSIHFLTKDASTEYLLVTQANSNTVTLLNVSNPQKVTALSNSPSLNKPIQALTTFKQYVIVTDGVTISIFSA